MRTTNTVLRSPVFLLLCLTASVFVIRDVSADAHLAAGRISDVINTKHNFAALYDPELPPNEQRTVKAATENQVCIFCHTPHGKPGTQVPFLWNHAMSGATYTSYDKTWSSSMQADINPMGNNSKMCLSCHDGTVALGTVGVFTDTSVPGASVTYPAVTTDVTPVTISMTGTNGGAMPGGAGATSGYTRNLGADLRNDHPISFTYDSTLATKDGELVDPASATYMGTRAGTGTVRNNTKLGSAGAPTDAIDTVSTRFAVPLEPTLSSQYATTAGSVECTTCHDPHLRSTDNSINIKFLRLNRLQKGDPGTGGTFNRDSDINCLACHNKHGWGASVHASPTDAADAYTTDAATLREIPAGTQMWEASCLNCHDAHTVQGARWLLREGTDNTNVPKQGGNAASEETCYQCHAGDANTVVGADALPNIKAEFALTGSSHPIGDETHKPQKAGDIVAEITTNTLLTADVGELIESPTNLNNRHAECTDCHNPHRAIKNALYDGSDTSLVTSATHRHDANVPHSNKASGALRGAWGVEPDYATSPTQFDPSNVPTTFVEKYGDPSNSISPVTMEYQVCLKCHSNYAYGVTPPLLQTPPSDGRVLTFTTYTNQAMEFQAPHPSDTAQSGTGADSAFEGGTNVNHRSWHPVIAATERDYASMPASNLLSPFDQGIGTQTMYCSDCHGSNNVAPDSVVPDTGRPWGPHGSESNFMVKADGDGLCLKCHNEQQYANGANVASQKSGFSCNSSALAVCGNAGATYYQNLHVYHAKRIPETAGAGRPSTYQCTQCHTAVPHGWKNKALLVNLDDVGPEAGFGTTGNAVAAPYSQGAYYKDARLKVATFAASGNWDVSSCGAGNGCH